MADKNEPELSNRVPLLANSYNVHDLDRALSHAVGLKTDDGRSAAIDKAVFGKAKLQDVLAGQNLPAVPEGCEMGEVQGADGRTVTAPVATPAKEEEEEKASVPPPDPDTSSQRRQRPAGTSDPAD